MNDPGTYAKGQQVSPPQPGKPVETERGTPLETTLARAGIILWAAWAVFWAIPPINFWVVAMSILAVIMSVREISRWKSWQRYQWPVSQRGKLVYPKWAWFAVGAVPISIAAELIDLVLTGPVGGSADGIYLPGVIGWIAGGTAVQFTLVKLAERRDKARSGTPRVAHSSHGTSSPSPPR